MENLSQEIRRLAKEKKAIIMAHYYERPEVQDIADYVGDSLALAQQAAQTDAEVIVLCGVKFMAETAAVLCPGKKVLLPHLEAGCSLADSCSAEALRQWKQAHPEYQVVSYVNTSAEVKALTDVVVTSSNALKIVAGFPPEAKILFGPDQNLGRYINRQLGRKMTLWDGGCHVHGRFDTTALQQLKAQYPEAVVLAHPECRQEVVALSDVVGSTQALLNYVKEHPQVTTFIVVTEPGVIHCMEKARPGATLIPVPRVGGGDNLCEHMKLTSLEDVYRCLKEEKEWIQVDAEVAAKAVVPIRRMLDDSRFTVHGS